jgi:opacity protein-like surface antigen
LHGGYGRVRLSDIGSFFPLPNASGYFGGFQTGYNWHFAPAWLLGVEADASFGNISGNLNIPGAIDKTEVDRLATARVRLGYVAGPSLWYVTGGAAAADLKWRIAVPGTFDLGLDAWNIGWTAGGGIEYAITPDWSVKAEYLYLGIRQQSQDWNAQTFKVGLNYHGPVLERLFTAR